MAVWDECIPVLLMGYYRSLKASQAAHDFAKAISDATKHFPSDERYVLASQLRRAAISAPSNLAEGQGRFGSREGLRHTRVAAASLVEADNLLLYALDCGYLSQGDYGRLVRLRERARRLVHGLAKGLDRSVQQ